MLIAIPDLSSSKLNFPGNSGEISFISAIKVLLVLPDVLSVETVGEIVNTSAIIPQSHQRGMHRLQLWPPFLIELVL